MSPIEKEFKMTDQVESNQELFDVARATLRKKPMFPPFYVKQSRRLSDLLDAGKIALDTDLLVLDHAGGTIVLDKTQMAQHHVAQGEMAGKPWLVTF